MTALFATLLSLGVGAVWLGRREYAARKRRRAIAQQSETAVDRLREKKAQLRGALKPRGTP